MTLTYSQGITKTEFVAEMQAHRAADHFIAGDYFDADTGKGCGIGCGIETINRLLGLSLEYDSHTGLANALGWPVWLCRMEDRIFEGLPPLERSAWPASLATAVPEGVDLKPALNQILARILREVVLPVARSSAAIVQRVADGCATNWVSDDPEKARQAGDACAYTAYTAYGGVVGTGVVRAYDADAYAYDAYTAYDAAYGGGAYGDAAACACDAAAACACDAAAAYNAAVAAAAAVYAAAAYNAGVGRDGRARQNAWLAIAQIVLEEVVKVEKLT